ncbi:MAG: type II secretion system protein [Acetanaerobacterium sp.]
MFKKLTALAAKKNRGFTLIELIVVIAILGILIAILVPSMVGFIRSARETAVKAEAKTVYTSVQAYITTDKLVNADADTDMELDGSNCITLLEAADLVDSSQLSDETPDITITMEDDGVTIETFTYATTEYTVTFPAGTVEEV